MTDSRFAIEERSCREVACPQCSAVIRFTTLHLTLTPHPFMYCEDCSSVLLRDSDQKRMYEILDRTPAEQMNEAVMRYLEQMEAAAPPCPCGSRFSTWAYVRCPSCRFEIPYNDGVQDPEVRAQNRIVIVIEGAKVIDDTARKSWQFQCKK